MLIALVIGGAAPPASSAATSAGQLYAFGRNDYGELGSATNNGTINPNPTPALITLPGASGPVTEIAAARRHSLALTSSGQLYAFGDNHYGQLGSAANNGTQIANPTPAVVTLPGASGPVTRIAAGSLHSLALTSSGQLCAFGLNDYGQLGSATNNGTEKANPTPALVTLPGTSGPVTEIAAGNLHNLVLTSTDQLYGFGDNHYGQLGSAANNGTDSPNPNPVPVDLGAGTTIDTVAPGSSAEQTLALVADLLVTTGSLPGGQVGAPYSANATAEGGAAPYTWQASGLPGGLSIDAASGKISGTPKKAGTAQVLLSVSDHFGIVAKSAAITLGVAPRPAISKLRQSHGRWREGRRLAKVSSLSARPKGGRPPLGTIFSFRLNTKAKVSLAFTEGNKGRKGKRSAGVTLTFTGHPGTNRVVFQGRVSRHKTLKPGRYKLTASASAEGERSQPRSLRFTIVR